jgi:phosphoglucosamine mutase
MRLVIDCAHGATYHVAPRVFEELGADVILIGAEPDGVNINDGCGTTHPEMLQEKVLAYRADAGIAFDGDGDRVYLVDGRGRLLDGDELLYVIATHRLAQGTLDGGVVGTVMSNFGLEKALSEKDIPFCRAKVGDRHVTELMHQKGWQLGGETSGHVLCFDLTTTGDAIVSALQALMPVVERGIGLDDLVSGMSKLPQIMVNVEVPDPGATAECAALQAAIADKEAVLAGRGRILVRASGTEPLLRVMVEGEDGQEVRDIANELARVAESQA